MRQGDKKLVYRLIQLFSSTEIFSKRRKIYTRMKENQSYILKLVLNISISTPAGHHQLVGCATWLLRMSRSGSDAYLEIKRGVSPDLTKSKFSSFESEQILM